MKSSARDRAWYLAIFAVALALRVAFVFQYQASHPNAAHLVIDEASYDAWARRIAAGDWLGTEVFFQEPLYPYFLGILYRIFGADPFVARIAQCVLGALTCVVTGWIARRAFGRGAGLVAAIATAVYWPLLLFPCLLLKENLFLPVFGVLVLALLRARDVDRAAKVLAPAGETVAHGKHPEHGETPEHGARAQRSRSLGAWCLVGCLAGLGALLRGNVLVLLPLFALWPWFSAREVRGAPGRCMARSVCVVAGALLVLLPVAFRNHAVGGVFALTTSGAGTNLYGGNNRENPYGRATEFSFVRGIPDHEAGDWRREAERRTGRALDPGEVSAYWRDEVLRSVREDPLLHLSILWSKLRLSLGAYEVPDNHLLYWDAQYVRLARLPFPAFGCVGVLGLAGLLIVAARRFTRRAPEIAADPSAASTLAVLFLAYLATIVLTVTSERARLPLVPILAAFAGAVAVRAIDVVRRREGSALAWIAGSVLAGAIVVHAPVVSASERADDFDERDFNLAVQRRDEPGRLDDARAIATRLVERHRKSARSRLLLAEIDFRRAIAAGEGSHAVAGAHSLSGTLANVEALLAIDALKPRERFHAESLAGWIELELGHWTNAHDRFVQALQFDQDSADLRRGMSLAARGEVAAGGDAAMWEEERKQLEALIANETDAARRLDLELAAARMESDLATALLESTVHDGDQARGRAGVVKALELLESVAKHEGDHPSQARRARLLAGWIQHYLKNDRAAENNFRKALRLGRDSEAELGLAFALYNRAVSDLDDAARPERLTELRALIEGLRGHEPVDPRVADLADRTALLH